MVHFLFICFTTDVCAYIITQCSNTFTYSKCELLQKPSDLLIVPLYVGSLRWLAMLALYAGSLRWLSMLALYVGSLCWLSGSLCWLSVLALYVGSLCWLSMLALYVSSLCWLSMLALYVGSLCWLSMLALYVGSLCWRPQGFLLGSLYTCRKICYLQLLLHDKLLSLKLHFSLTSTLHGSHFQNPLKLCMHTVLFTWELMRLLLYESHYNTPFIYLTPTLINQLVSSCIYEHWSWGSNI